MTSCCGGAGEQICIRSYHVIASDLYTFPVWDLLPFEMWGAQQRAGAYKTALCSDLVIQRSIVESARNTLPRT